MDISKFDESYYSFLNQTDSNDDEVLKRLVSQASDAQSPPIRKPVSVDAAAGVSEKISALASANVNKLTVNELVTKLGIGRSAARTWIKEIRAYDRTIRTWDALAASTSPAPAPGKVTTGIFSGVAKRYRRYQILKKLNQFIEQTGSLSDAQKKSGVVALSELRAHVRSDFGQGGQKVFDQIFRLEQRISVGARVVEFYVNKRDKVEGLTKALASALTPQRRQTLRRLLWKERGALGIAQSQLRQRSLGAIRHAVSKIDPEDKPFETVQAALGLSRPQVQAVQVLNTVQAWVEKALTKLNRPFSAEMASQIARSCMTNPTLLAAGGAYDGGAEEREGLQRSLREILGGENDLLAMLKDAHNHLDTLPGTTDEQLCERLGVSRGDLLAMRIGEAVMVLKSRPPTDMELAQQLGITASDLQEWYRTIESSREAVASLMSLGASAPTMAKDKFNEQAARLLTNASAFLDAPTPMQIRSMERIASRLQFSNPELFTKARAVVDQMVGKLRKSRLTSLVKITEQWGSERDLRSAVRRIQYAKIPAAIPGIAGPSPVRRGDIPSIRNWVDQAPDMLKTTVEDPKVQNQESAEYTPERRKLHDELIAHAIGTAQPVPADQKPVAILMMGGSGCGKSSLVDSLEEEGDFVHVNCDDLMVRLPEYQQALNLGTDPSGKVISARDAAARCRSEARDITINLEQQASNGRYNLIYDGTGQMKFPYKRMIRELKEKGYHVRVIMPEVSKEEACDRVSRRAEGTGRYIPEGIVTDIHGRARENFPEIAAAADEAMLFDNRGEKPRLVWRRSGDQAIAIDPDYFTGEGQGLESLPGVPEHAKAAAGVPVHFETPAQRAQHISTVVANYQQNLPQLQVEALLVTCRSGEIGEREDWLAECLSVGVQEAIANAIRPTVSDDTVNQVAKACVWHLANSKKGIETPSDIQYSDMARSILVHRPEIVEQFESALMAAQSATHKVLEGIHQRQKQRLAQIEQGMIPSVPESFHATNSLAALTSIDKSDIEVGSRVFRGAFVSTRPEFNFGFLLYGLTGPGEQDTEPLVFRQVSSGYARWTGYNEPIEVHPRARELKRDFIQAAAHVLCNAYEAAIPEKDRNSVAANAFRERVLAQLEDSLVVRYDDEKGEWRPYFVSEVQGGQAQAARVDLDTSKTIQPLQAYLKNILEIAALASSDSAADLESQMSDIAFQVVSQFNPSATPDKPSVGIREPLSGNIRPAAVIAPDDDPLLLDFWKRFSAIKKGAEVQSATHVGNTMSAMFKTKSQVPVIPLFEQLIELAIVQQTFSTGVLKRWEARRRAW